MNKDNKSNTEIKKDSTEKAKTVKKSSYSKKKKAKKNILNGIAYVQSTFNNTIVSIADNNGNIVSTGIYIYQLQAGEFFQARKMVFLK